MKVLSATFASLLLTVSQALASGGSAVEGVGLLGIFFMGFGALIVVFQLVPAIVLLGGMFKELFASAEKKPVEVMVKKL